MKKSERLKIERSKSIVSRPDCDKDNCKRLIQYKCDHTCVCGCHSWTSMTRVQFNKLTIKNRLI